MHKYPDGVCAKCKKQMGLSCKNIQIISAPSILGLKPNGVEDLGKSLLASGLEEALRIRNSIIHVDTLNDKYSKEKDASTNILNAKAIRDFSLALGQTINDTMEKNRFPFVLGGDCSILIGIISTLKVKGSYGLIFLDAHADFYQPEKSITGEVADMDLAIVTGRGPELLTNINNLQPYVKDENVIHVGQRDWEETRKYGSQDIRKTQIKCFSLADIRKQGIAATTADIFQHLEETQVEGFWIHYDTDILSDEINPAVDYRLPGGLQFEEVEYLIRSLLRSGRMAGMTVTIFNPQLDKSGSISRNITESLGKAFDLSID
jgi:arginase